MSWQIKHGCSGQATILRVNPLGINAVLAFHVLPCASIPIQIRADLGAETNTQTKRAPQMYFPSVLVTIAILALSTVTTSSLSAQAPPSEAALDTLIAQRMADASIMGVGAAAIVNRQVVWMKGYGFTDYERTQHFTPHTVMNIGSITKPFTGVAICVQKQRNLGTLLLCSPYRSSRSPERRLSGIRRA